MNYAKLMYALLAVGALVVVWTLIKRDASDDSKFYLDDLLVDEETGTASVPKCLLVAAFFLLAWMMIYLTVTGKMDHEYFNSFGQLFVAPFVIASIQRVGKAFAGRKMEAPAPAPATPASVTVNSVVENK